MWGAFPHWVLSGVLRGFQADGASASRLSPRRENEPSRMLSVMVSRMRTDRSPTAVGLQLDERLFT